MTLDFGRGVGKASQAKESLLNCNDSLLVHPPWSVMEVSKLHCHLVEDGEEVVLSGSQLGLQVLLLLFRQLWGTCECKETKAHWVGEGQPCQSG